MATSGPFGDALSLQEAMARLVDQGFVRARQLSHGSTGLDVPIDLYDAGDGFVLRAMLPGARPEEVQVTVLGATVRLSGSIDMHRAEPERQASWLVHEVPHGAFARTITLPERADADRASAEFEAGILTLHLPKAEANRPRRISVSAR